MYNTRANIQQHLTSVLGIEVPGRKTWIPKQHLFQKAISSSNYTLAKSKGPSFHQGTRFPMLIPASADTSLREEINRKERAQASN